MIESELWFLLEIGKKGKAIIKGYVCQEIFLTRET